MRAASSRPALSTLRVLSARSTLLALLAIGPASAGDGTAFAPLRLRTDVPGQGIHEISAVVRPGLVRFAAGTTLFWARAGGDPRVFRLGLFEARWKPGSSPALDALARRFQTAVHGETAFRKDLDSSRRAVFGAKRARSLENADSQAAHPHADRLLFGDEPIRANAESAFGLLLETAALPELRPVDGITTPPRASDLRDCGEAPPRFRSCRHARLGWVVIDSRGADVDRR